MLAPTSIYDWICPNHDWICTKYCWICPNYDRIFPKHDWICPNYAWIFPEGAFNMTGFALSMTGLFLDKTGLFLNMTGFGLNLSGFGQNNTGIKLLPSSSIWVRHSKLPWSMYFMYFSRAGGALGELQGRLGDKAAGGNQDGFNQHPLSSASVIFFCNFFCK